MEEVLAPRALVVEAARRGERARDERHDGEDEEEEPARARDPLAHFARVALKGVHEDVAGALEAPRRRFRERQERTRHAVRHDKIGNRREHEEETHGQVELPSRLHGRHDDAEEVERQERHEDDALDEPHAHARAQQRDTRGKRLRPAQHRHEEREEEQGEADVEDTVFEVRRRLPHRRREDAGQARRETRHDGGAVHEPDRVLLPHRATHEEANEPTHEPRRQDAAHERDEVDAHGDVRGERKTAHRLDDGAPDGALRRVERVHPHPLRTQSRRLAGEDIPRQGQGIDHQRHERNAEHAQPQTDAERRGQYLLISHDVAFPQRMRPPLYRKSRMRGSGFSSIGTGWGHRITPRP